MTAQAEPAIRSYFFGKGYRDLWSTIRESWRRNWTSAQGHLSKARAKIGTDDSWWAILWGAAGFSVVVFGTVIFLIASVFHIVILITFFLLVYLAFSLVFLVEWVYLTAKGFFAVCPECHAKNSLPEYFCPNCSRVHSRLVPSSYGILRRTCQCGEILPATFFLKRGELQARCPDCETLLSREHTETRKVFIPIFGGPAAGKSAYLFATVRELVERWAPDEDVESYFLDSGTESDYQQVKSDLERGRPPSKTTAKLPRAFNLNLQRGGNGTPRLLYLYDPAGEAFQATEGMSLHAYQDYFSGLLFLVDPFGLPIVQSDYQDRLPAVEEDLKPSELPVEDVLSRTLISLQENCGLSTAGRVKAPIAVVLTKIDAFDLRSLVGQPALQSRLRASPSMDSAEVQNQLIREQLMRWNQGALVHEIEARFTRFRYFACSSLGHMPGKTRPFEAEGVLEPLLWILEHQDSAFFRRRGTRSA